MRAAITRLITASAIVLVFLAACTGPSPTDPGSGRMPVPTAAGDPPDQPIKR